MDIEKLIAENLLEIMDAKRIQPVTKIERQRKIVAVHSMRCPRCGNKVAPMFPQACFCGGCIDYFRGLDRARWFDVAIEDIDG